MSIVRSTRARFVAGSGAAVAAFALLRRAAERSPSVASEHLRGVDAWPYT